MKRHIFAGLTIAAFAAACTPQATGPSTNELLLAQEAQVIAQDAALSSGATHDGWLRRVFEALRTTDDPEARAFLAQARAYQDSARMAIQAGDREAARHYFQLAFRSVLSAVIEIFPNAPARTGEVVDDVIARIELRLGDREAPRIRMILAHVSDLRDRADSALAAGDPVTALALNLRGLQILHFLVEHIRYVHDHDAVADSEMEAGVSP